MEMLLEGKIFTSFKMASEEMCCQRATLAHAIRTKGWYLFDNQLAHLAEMVVTKNDVAKIIITDTDTGEIYYYMRESEAANLLEMGVKALSTKLRAHKYECDIDNYHILFRAYKQKYERKQKKLKEQLEAIAVSRRNKELMKELERKTLFEQKRKRTEELREQAKKEACRGSNCPFTVCNGLRCSRVNDKLESLLKKK